MGAPIDPKEWTPEIAKEARDYVAANPGNPEFEAMVAQYDRIQAGAKLRESFKRDPELHQPAPQGVMGYIKHLPSLLGGGTEQWEPPTREAFQKLLHSEPGLIQNLPGGGEMGPPSKETFDQLYKDFVDASWAADYDDAKAKGLSIVRLEKPKETEGEKVKYRQESYRKDAAELPGVALHVANGASMGLATPALRGAAQFVGDALDPQVKGPNSQGSKWSRDIQSAEDDVSPGTALAAGLAGGLVNPLGKVLGVGAELPGLARAGVRGLVGAGVSAGAGELDDAATNALNKAAGSDARVESDPMLRAMIGFGLPVAGEALGGLGNAAKNALRESAAYRGLVPFEDAGGETSVLRKLVPPPVVRGYRATAGLTGEHPVDLATEAAKPSALDAVKKFERVLPDDLQLLMAQAQHRGASAVDIAAEGAAKPISAEAEKLTPRLPADLQALLDEAQARQASPVDLAAAKARGPIAGEAARREADLPAQIHAENEALYESPGGKRRVPHAGLLKETHRLIQEGSYDENGRALPYGRQYMAPLTDALRSMSRARAMTAEDAAAYTHAHPEVVSMPANTAKRLGLRFKIPEDVTDTGQSEAERLRDVRVVLTARSMNARELDTVTSFIDSMANAPSNAGRKDQAMNRLMKAVREGRESYDEGWPALKESQSKRLGEHKSLMENVGIRGRTKFEPQDVEQPIGDVIRGFGNGEGRLDKDAALRALAKDPASLEMVRRIRNPEAELPPPSPLLGSLGLRPDMTGQARASALSDVIRGFGNGEGRLDKDAALRALAPDQRLLDLVPLARHPWKALPEKTQALFERLGINESMSPIEREKTLAGLIRNYRNGEGAKPGDDALEALMPSNKPLLDVAATRFADAHLQPWQKSIPFPGNFMNAGRHIADSAILRGDPLMRGLPAFGRGLAQQGINADAMREAEKLRALARSLHK